MFKFDSFLQFRTSFTARKDSTTSLQPWCSYPCIIDAEPCQRLLFMTKVVALSTYVLLRELVLFSETLFIVDKFQRHGHSSCCLASKAATYSTVPEVASDTHLNWIDGSLRSQQPTRCPTRINQWLPLTYTRLLPMSVFTADTTHDSHRSLWFNTLSPLRWGLRRLLQLPRSDSCLQT